MGLLDKLKKGKENRETEEKQHYEQQFQQDLSQKADSQIRPGGVFMVQLLMKEKCEMPVSGLQRYCRSIWEKWRSMATARCM